MATLAKEKEIVHSSERQQPREVLAGIYEDECTWLAETLNGSMRTSFDFKLRDGQLVSSERDEDGVMRHRNLRQMYEEGAVYAKERAARDSRVRFEVEREKRHLEELAVMEKMAAGQAPNTMIVVSPFPESLEGRTEEDIQGYKPKLRRSMLRVITADKEGLVTVKTQSLDGTNQEALLAIYKEMNWPIRDDIGSEQMLAERMYAEFSDKEQSVLTDRLMEAYDSEMVRQNGGEWRAGRRQLLDRGDTWQFVLNQKDVLEKYFEAVIPLRRRVEQFNQLEDEQSLEALRFMTAATMRDRYEGKVIDASRGVEGEMCASADAAAERGEEFGGCGLTTSMQKEDIMQKMGYRVEDALKCVTCPLCGATVDAIRTSSGIKCPSCHKEALSSGKIIDHSQPAEVPLSDRSGIKTIWDSLALGSKSWPGYSVHKEISIGGARVTIQDKTGETIAEGRQAEKIARTL